MRDRRYTQVKNALIAAVALVGLTSGCVVVGLDHFYEASTLTFDDRLVGTWQDLDDHVTLIVERGEWQTYRLQYDHPTEKGVLTGFLFKVGQKTYLDVMPVRGQDPGSFTLPAHALLQLSVGTNVVVKPLRLDWFAQAMEAHTLSVALQAVRGERSQIILAVGHEGLLKWLTARPADDPAFGPEFTFKRQ